MVSEGPPEQDPASKNNSSGTSATASTSATMGSDTAGKEKVKPKHTAAPQGVKETHRIFIDYNPVSGRKQLNTYEIVRELGRGEHGRVKLGYDLDTHAYVAIKLLNRNEKPRLGRPRGSSTEEKIHREIAILKKCSHRNIVQLLEVLDDESSRKIYLVLEYCEKGEIRWQTPRGDPALARDKARAVARNVVLGLEYLHANGIIHRDIKPANLLVSADDTVKISDFGVSYAVTGEASSELELAKTVGTPAFFAPELCVPTEFLENGMRRTPPVGSKVDVWAFGVTLYCLLYGCLPFEADNEYELFRVIANGDVYYPDPGEDEDLRMANELLQKLLRKDPHARPSMHDIKGDPWILRGLSSTKKSEFLNSSARRIEVSTEEVDQAVKGVSITNRIKQGLSRIADHIRTRSRSQTRAQSGSGASTRQRSGSPSPPPSNNTHASFTGASESACSSISSPSSLESESTSLQGGTPSPPASDKMPQFQTRAFGSTAISRTSTPPMRQDSLPLPTDRPPSLPKDNPKRMPSNLGMGLMPMKLDEKSLSSSHTGSLEDVTTMAPAMETAHPGLPDMPRVQDDDFWDSQSSSSSEEDDSGELTLVVSRNRSRSMDRPNPTRRVSRATTTTTNK